jgi:hypothetical protein
MVACLGKSSALVTGSDTCSAQLGRLSRTTFGTVDLRHPFTGKYMITRCPHKNWQHKIYCIVIPMKSKMSLPLALNYTTPRAFAPSPTPTVPWLIALQSHLLFSTKA